MSTQKRYFLRARLIGCTSSLVVPSKINTKIEKIIAPTSTKIFAYHKYTETRILNTQLPPTSRREPRDQRDVVGRELWDGSPSRSSSRGGGSGLPDRHQVTRPDVVDAGLRALWEIGREAGLATSQRIDRLQSQ